MSNQAVNFTEKLTQITDHWAPKIVGQLNDYHLKLAKVEGDFVWHDHPETDEVFIVLKGSLRLDFRDKAVTLNEGEMYVVPKGVEHKPFAAAECHILLIEPAGTVNTGDVGGELTAVAEWL